MKRAGASSIEANSVATTLKTTNGCLDRFGPRTLPILPKVHELAPSLTSLLCQRSHCFSEVQDPSASQRAIANQSCRAVRGNNFTAAEYDCSSRSIKHQSVQESRPLTRAMERKPQDHDQCDCLRESFSEPPRPSHGTFPNENWGAACSRFGWLISDCKCMLVRHDHASGRRIPAYEP